LKSSFSAWSEGLPLYLPLLIIGLVLFILGQTLTASAPNTLLVLRLMRIAGIVVFLAGLCTLGFFRDPKRRVTAAPNELVAPADGVVVGIEDLDESPHYDGPCKRISIFLSIFDVHVNRAPYDCTVRDVRYAPGKFLDARKPETTQVNESTAIRMDTQHGSLTVRQISGAVARRIVCKCEQGKKLAKGEKFGMIKFGSRTELYLPRETAIYVKMKETVRAGTTVVARF